MYRESYPPPFDRLRVTQCWLEGKAGNHAELAEEYSRMVGQVSPRPAFFTNNPTINGGAPEIPYRFVWKIS